MRVKRIFVSLIGFAIAGSLMSIPVRADQPRMQAAKSDLDNALKYLRQATADKGGHREKAIDLATRALTAVNNGIEYDRTHITPHRNHASNIERSNLSADPVNLDQPNMTTARTYLNSAWTNLNRASADKGTYRVEAMNLIRQAIAEVDAGIEYDRTH